MYDDVFNTCLRAVRLKNMYDPGFLDHVFWGLLFQFLSSSLTCVSSLSFPLTPCFVSVCSQLVYLWSVEFKGSCQVYRLRSLLMYLCFMLLIPCPVCFVLCALLHPFHQLDSGHLGLVSFPGVSSLSSVYLKCLPLSLCQSVPLLCPSVSVPQWVELLCTA